MPPEYATREELTDFKNEVRDDLREIKDNHLQHIREDIKEGNLRLSSLELKMDELKEFKSEVMGCLKTAKWMIATGIAIAGVFAGIIGALVAAFA